MEYQLRERYPTTLEDMQNNAISVEDNLLAKKSKIKVEKIFTIKEEPTTSSDAKFDTLDKTREKMIEKISLTNWVATREPYIGPQIRNPNFRRQPRMQNKPREKKGPEQSQRQVRPPFQQNYAEDQDEEDENLPEDQILFFGDGRKMCI